MLSCIGGQNRRRKDDTVRDGDVPLVAIEALRFALPPWRISVSPSDAIRSRATFFAMRGPPPPSGSGSISCEATRRSMERALSMGTTMEVLCDGYFPFRKDITLHGNATTSVNAILVSRQGKRRSP